MKLISAAALACLLSSAPEAGERPSGKGSLLILHYRWRHDTLTLVESKRIEAAIKPSRSRAWDAAHRNAIPAAENIPRSPFSYEVVAADGSVLAVKHLQDPGIRRVEFQVRGESMLRQETAAVDSSDIFVRIPEPEAAAIRFFRHGRSGAGAVAGDEAGADGGAKGSGGNAGRNATALGPEPAPAKTLLAEFTLE